MCVCVCCFIWLHRVHFAWPETSVGKGSDSFMERAFGTVFPPLFPPYPHFSCSSSGSPSPAFLYLPVFALLLGVAFVAVRFTHVPLFLSLASHILHMLVHLYIYILSPSFSFSLSTSLFDIQFSICLFAYALLYFLFYGHLSRLHFLFFPFYPECM